MCSDKTPRPYTLKKRAEKQAETQRRIVEAALDLHGTVGPANTTLSMVAERAGVQRHTLYAHFPDERSLLMACSGLHLQRSPVPDADPWRSIEDRHERVRTGLLAIYGWFEKEAALTACVLRDAEVHPLTREITELRLGPTLASWRTVLGEGLPPRKQAVLHLALSFFTWRTLVGESSLGNDEAVDLMMRALESA